MKCFLGLALLAASATASAATSVVVADNDFRWLPMLESRGTFGLTPDAITSIHQLVLDGQCKLEGLEDERNLDMQVPFAAHFQPDGVLDKIVIKRLGCPKVEGILGGVLLDMFARGEFRATGANQDGWYRSELNFSSRV
jgi:hypothetical protein